MARGCCSRSARQSQTLAPVQPVPTCSTSAWFCTSRTNSITLAPRFSHILTLCQWMAGLSCGTDKQSESGGKVKMEKSWHQIKTHGTMCHPAAQTKRCTAEPRGIAKTKGPQIPAKLPIRRHQTTGRKHSQKP